MRIEQNIHDSGTQGLIGDVGGRFGNGRAFRESFDTFHRSLLDIASDPSMQFLDGLPKGLIQDGASLVSSGSMTTVFTPRHHIAPWTVFLLLSNSEGTIPQRQRRS